VKHKHKLVAFNRMVTRTEYINDLFAEAVKAIRKEPGMMRKAKIKAKSLSCRVSDIVEYLAAKKLRRDFPEFYRKELV